MTHPEFNYDKKVLLETRVYTPSAYYFVAERTARVPFLHHEILESDCNGLEYKIVNHDITIRIPPGAVAMKEKVHLEIAVTMCGPFYYPGNAQPISPILWLCLLNENIALKKPFEVEIPHFLTNLDKENAYHKVGFAKANHNNYTLENDQVSYHFLPCDEDCQFVHRENSGYGILRTNHCCFYCIQAEKSPELTLDTNYCLVRIRLQSLSLQVSKFKVYFVAAFFLRTCLTVSTSVFYRKFTTLYYRH